MRSLGGFLPETVRAAVRQIAEVGRHAAGRQPRMPTCSGVIELKDIVKGGIKERFAELRQMGIKTVMITGDNPLTAAAIAAEAGVDDFLAEATPEAKLSLIREYQKGGRLVAMTGDGTNDAPALAQADVAVAMNSGTQAAKEAGNMVDLDSNPTKLIEIVNIGKQLLMTRGALTTFSIANDVAKYFAILPAAFAATYPALKALDLMRLSSPASAILSAVIFNALIIIALVPLALRGVAYRPVGAAQLLAQQSAGLRPGRTGRAVHWDQGHRLAAVGRGTGLNASIEESTLMLQQLRTVAGRCLSALTLLTGVVYPAARDRHRPGGVSASGQRQHPHDRRQGGRLGADRPVVHEARVLLGTAVGDRPVPLQRRGVQRLELRAAASRP